MRQILIHFTFLFVISACSSQDKNIDFSEYDILTTANELVQYYDISLDTSGLFEMARIRKYIDGAYELKYEYDLMESETFLPLFYSIKINYRVSCYFIKSTRKISLFRIKTFYLRNSL